jgi:hypothetical protein
MLVISLGLPGSSRCSATKASPLDGILRLLHTHPVIAFSDRPHVSSWQGHPPTKVDPPLQSRLDASDGMLVKLILPAAWYSVLLSRRVLLAWESP